MKIGMTPLHLLEFFAVVNAIFVARPINQPVLVPLVAVWIGEEPLRHAAKWRDARAGSNEEPFGSRLAHYEQSVRPVKGDARADLEIAEPVRHKAVVDAIQADIEGRVITRRRRDGIRARVNLAVRLGLPDGNELAGRKIELGELAGLEFQMLGLRRQEDGLG